MRTAYFLCNNSDKDPVAPLVLAEYKKMRALIDTGRRFLGGIVWEWQNEDGDILHLMETPDVLSHIFDTAVDDLERNFSASGYDFAAVINWHAGNNAPERIFCFHGIGDAERAVFAQSDARTLRNLRRILIQEMTNAGLAGEWDVLEEATHYSGTGYGCRPETLLRWNVPMADIEIGSSREQWSNPDAVRVVAKSLELLSSPAGMVTDDVFSTLFVGGTHFEPAVRELSEMGTGNICFPHALTYPWITAGLNVSDVTAEMLVPRIAAAAAAMTPAPKVVVFHDKAKANLKNAARKVAGDRNIPCISHRAARLSLPCPRLMVMAP